MKLCSLCAGLALVSLTACQTLPYQPYARSVKLRPQEGGVIALNSSYRDEDRAKANDLMRNNCGETPFKVLEEGEVVVGSTTNSSATEDTDYGHKRQVGTLFGLPVTSGSDKQATTNSTANTTQLKEWQISYACQVAQAGTIGTKVSKTRKKVSSN